MKTFIVLGVLGLLLVSCVSGYICINPQEDNIAVQEFKAKMNYLALEQDIENGITQDAFQLKIKYFGPCNN